MDEKNWAVSVLTSAKADLRDDIWTYKNRSEFYMTKEYSDYLIERAEKRISEIDEALVLLETTK